MSQPTQEENHRLKILSSILRCPHRDIDKILQIHIEAQEADPVFYAKLAVWHDKNGELRDHNEAFIGLLCTDSILEHRETGLALLRKLPPYMKERVKGLIKGKTIKIREKLNSTFVRKGKKINKVNIKKKTVGMKRNIPRSFKTEIYSYLDWLEQDDVRFDETVLRNFNPIQGLYASLRIKPSERARGIMFEGNIPEGSRLSIIKEILGAKTPVEKAELIVKNKIPYTIAVGLVDKMSPSILISLISVMTPQEVINNISSLKERGAYDNAEVKQLVLDKLAKAEKKKGVAALKSKVAKNAAKVDDDDINKQLDKVADEGIKKRAQISLPTAIIVDKSGSMEKAIEVGKQLASAVSGATISDLCVVATDTFAREIKANGKTLTAWENAFRGIRASGGTSLGAGVAYLNRINFVAEQIVIITDEGENNTPTIGNALTEYIKQTNITPNVVVIKVPPLSAYWVDTQSTRRFQDNIKKALGDFTRLELENDSAGYYAIPTIIPLLAGGSQLELLYEIMDYDFLQRKPFEDYGRKPRKKKTEKKELATA